jgi:hypothetical protein
MRLFHEASGAWFWWSMESGAQYVRLHKYAFNYLTVTKGLKNMLWMLPFNGSPNAAFFPGKEFVDLGGADTYAGDGNYGPQTAIYNNCVKVFGIHDAYCFARMRSDPGSSSAPVRGRQVGYVQCVDLPLLPIALEFGGAHEGGLHQRLRHHAG